MVKPNKNKRGERKEDFNVIYGAVPVIESLRSGRRKLQKVLIAETAAGKSIAEIVSLTGKNGVRLERVSKRVLDNYFDEQVNHQGVLAFGAAVDYFDADVLISELANNPHAFCLILDGVEDPRNLGAILRTAEAAGVFGVFIPERRAVGLTDTVIKASAGAAEFLKIARVTNINRLIEELKALNVWVIGTDGSAETTYDEWDWKQPSALVVGNEGTGLHRLTSEKCDVLVRIPMLGKIGSLNVSVAAGVIMFEAVKQRRG
ncbi:MAG: 23S rRNA (guanosine(2251)-2'-O)-methyltransferase RlmB [Pyrinomonadaceae bacterium]